LPETVVGVLKTRSDAAAATRQLEKAGFSRSEIELESPGHDRQPDYRRNLKTGAAVGCVVGGLGGALIAGVATGGALPIVLLGIVAGVITGFLAGIYVSMAASTGRGLHYQQEVESGRFLITVISDRPAEALEILRSAGALEASPIDAPVQDQRPKVAD
jgi:hypothetical protein